MSVRPILGLALVLAACGGAPRDEGSTLRADLVGDAGDPAGTAPRAVAMATQEGLVAVDAAGRVVPGLATSWRIADDGLSIIFRLRPAAWPDGRKVTAADVVAVFRRETAAASRNRFKPLLAGVTVGAPVENVVEVRLPGAMPELLQLLAQPELAIVRGGPRPPSIGPFTVAAAATDAPAAAPIRLQRNPAYHAAATVALGAVEITPVDDPGPAIARFARDRTDLVTGAGLTGFGDARLLQASNALRVEPSWGVYGYVVNTRRAPLADPRVRRALSMAIDRDDLGSRLFGVAMTPVLGLVPPLPSEQVPPLPDWAIKAPAERLALARALLAEAGFTADAPLRLTISLPQGREHALVAQEITADFGRIGVGVRLATRTTAAHAVTLARGDFDLAMLDLASPVDSPLVFLARFACAARTGGYCNRDADALVAEGRAMPDPAARAAALARAEAMIVADAPFVPLFAPIRWSLVARRVGGWANNAAGIHPLGELTISGAAPAR